VQLTEMNQGSKRKY